MDAFKLISILLVAALPSARAATTINKKTYETAKPAETTSAPAEPTLRLKKVFLFPSLDDLSGVLAPKLDEKLIQLFRKNTRFDLVLDPQVLKALSPDDKSYGKAALSEQVHKEAARVTGSDTTVLLRTRNVGSETEMTLEFRNSEGELLFSETGSIPGFSPMEARWGLIEKLYQSVLAKIPFDATVTGRTANTITIDLGGSSLSRGEELDLVRIVSVQRHPLLKTIVGTDYVRVGRARVTNVDSSLSFAEITEESSGEMVKAGSKVLKSRMTGIRRSEPEDKTAYRPRAGETEEFAEKEKSDPFDDRLKGEFDQPKPRYGQAGVNLQYGSLSHSQSVSGTSTELSGSGIGGNLEGEIWVTKNWILSLYYGFHNATLAGSGLTAGDSSWKRFDALAGYRFFPSEIAEGAQVTGGIGYQTMTFTVPTPSGSSISGKTYSGIALRVDGEILIFKNSKISTGVGFQPFSSLADKGASPGSPDGGTVISFQLGWHFRFADLFWGKIGLQYDTASGNYGNNSTVNNKRFAIGPGIIYSF